MPNGSDNLNLDASLHMIGQAATAVVCNICFNAALHGLALAAVVATVGLCMRLNRRRFGPPLLAVAGKLSLFCLLMLMPGSLFWLTMHSLPSTGSFHISSLGFLIFWMWISLHLSAEEMNFEWF